MRAIRFQAGRPPHSVPPGELPAAPGDDLWLEVRREELPGGDSPQIARWLRDLHPLTLDTLRRGHPAHLAVAHTGYLHLRVPLPGPSVPDHPPTCDIVLGHDYVLTVVDREHVPWEGVWQQYQEGRRSADSVHFALYHALRAVLEQWRNVAEDVSRRGERVSQRLLRLSAKQILPEIMTVRREAMRLRGRLVPLRDGLQLCAAGGGSQPLQHGVRPYFDDLRREADEALASVEAVREAMGEAVQGFTSVQQTEMNRVMQLFTVLAVVIAPPMLVASIYGMNFRIPEYNWPHGYSYALALIFALTLGFYAYVRYRHWL